MTPSPHLVRLVYLWFYRKFPALLLSVNWFEMAACETTTENVDCDLPNPPSLSVAIPKKSDLSFTSKRWAEIQLPIDVLLLAVKDEVFLSCYYFLSDVVRSFTRALGYVYFGTICKEGELKLKVALITCAEGGGDPGGAAMAVKNAVENLQPKAVLCIGSCRGLHRDKVNLGDVVVPSKLTTYARRRMTNSGIVPCGFTTPLSSSMSRLIRQAGFGWKPPLKNPEAREVKVHRDCELLSGPDEVESSKRCHELVGLYPNAIAVELDGDGVFVAAHDLQTEWVVIKGISGYADCGASIADEQWVPFAGVMAASVMYNILSDPFVFEQWPHYQNTVNCSQRSQNEAPVNGGYPLPITRDPGKAHDFLGSLVQTFAGNCDSGQLNYKGRIIHYSARGRIHSWGELWVYDGSAWDQDSGITAEAHHYDHSQKAIQQAVEKLKGKLRDAGILKD